MARGGQAPWAWACWPRSRGIEEEGDIIAAAGLWDVPSVGPTSLPGADPSAHPNLLPAAAPRGHAETPAPRPESRAESPDEMCADSKYTDGKQSVKTDIMRMLRPKRHARRARMWMRRDKRA